MKIEQFRVWTTQLKLREPFTIAFHTTEVADIAVVQLVLDSGLEGIGAAAPFEAVTGEAFAMTCAALGNGAITELSGRRFDTPATICRLLPALFPDTPAARAAIDMALYDVWSKQLGLPLADALGRAHAALPTSITMGIRPLGESLEDARTFLELGYTTLKVKGGKDLTHDVTLLRELRKRFGSRVKLRVDLNQGYDMDTFMKYLEQTATLDLELVEQPLPINGLDELRHLPEAVRARIAVDENLQSPRDAVHVACPPIPGAIANVKLMKCGGIYPALQIAAIAEAAGLQLMWGCMVESRIGLAAALHAALACPATTYLDLDGDTDLVEDIASGGMLLKQGWLRTTDAPGLGIEVGVAAGATLA